MSYRLDIKLRYPLQTTQFLPLWTNLEIQTFFSVTFFPFFIFSSTSLQLWIALSTNVDIRTRETGTFSGRVAVHGCPAAGRTLSAPATSEPADTPPS